MRKKIEQSSLTPDQENINDQPGDDTVSLQFVEADDTVEPEKPPSKLKKAFTSVFTTTDEEEANAKKPRKRKSTFFVKHVALVCGGMLFVIHLLVPEEYKNVFYVQDKAYTLLPTEEQMADMLTPLARIADRHTHIADVNPDLVDILASIQASAAYGMELRATLILKAHIDKKAKETENFKQQEVWRNRLNGFTE